MQFKLKAMRAGEGVTRLSIDAADAADASLLAQQQGYTVLSVEVPLWGRQRKRHFPLVLFSQELNALLSAGLSLVEAMEALAEKEHQSEVKRLIEDLVAALFEGKSFSQALALFPDTFPALYTASIRAAERTGDLSQALSRYIAYQSQLDLVKKKLLAASIYPVLLMVVGGLVTLFLLGYVVPRFSHVFEDLGGDIPFLSRVLIQWGLFLEAYAMHVGVGLIVGLAALVYLARLPDLRRWLEYRLWQLPAVGERMRIYQLARFYRSLGMLLNGGIPIVTALGMTKGLLHPLLRSLLDLAESDIREGKSISHSMEKHGLTTPVALRMLRVGERTGSMGEMMERIAAFYDEEMARWVEWFTRLFEPILMALIGIVIGAIVVLMYMPIFELAGSIQ